MRTTADGDGITSTYSVGSLLVTQRIELVNNASSEQLGTAQILYTVENLSDKEQAVKSRLLMDTMLGEQDYGLYEAGNGDPGDGFQGYVTETMLDGGEEGSRIPGRLFRTKQHGRVYHCSLWRKQHLEDRKALPDDLCPLGQSGFHPL